MSDHVDVAAVDAPTAIDLRIDRLVVETRHGVDAFALQCALVDAVRAVVEERGVPAAWRHDARTGAAVIRGFAWDGQGGEPGLARALALRLYERVLTPEAPA
jgi:hypothetical protein